MASISFTDGTGAATLTNGKVAPGDRFAGWTPQTRPVGTRVYAQARGAAPVFFQTGTDYAASFSLEGIPEKRVAGVSMVDIADRLIHHLLAGGTCTVTTGDDVSTVFTGCWLAEGSEPSLTLTDRKLLEFTLSLTLCSTSAMRVYYGGGS